MNISNDPDRYYIINKHGMATLCADLQDATSSAAEADEMWPAVAPHRVAVMVPLAEYQALPTASDSVEQLEKAAAESREIVRALMRELPRNLRGDRGNAPGHSHLIPGVWDNDNGSLSGQPCAWCMAWSKAKAYASNQAMNHFEDARGMVEPEQEIDID